MRTTRRNRRRSATAAAAVLLTGVLGAPAHAAEGIVINADAPGTVDGQYIVALNGATSLAPTAAAQVSAQARDLVRRHGGSVQSVFSAVLRGFAADMTAEQARHLAADPAVRYVQKSVMVHTAGPGTQPSPPSWGLDRVDGRQDRTYAYPGTGTGVTVYVLDTGVRISHRTFEGRASYGYDFVDKDTTAQDCHGHGTHVAGTVGGEQHGVAKDVRIVAVRVLDCDGYSPDRYAIQGLEWVAKNAHKPAIGNMSIGSDPPAPEPQAFREATRGAIRAGIQFAIAAGNDSRNGCDAPGDVAEAVTLGSTDEGDRRSYFSNYGRCIDLFAPGGDIVSADNESDTGEVVLGGTSMATPHAAGALALYLEGHPNATPQESRNAVVRAAQPGVVSDAGGGSPNLLLNVTALARLAARR
ncbi:S8 family peptidase [Actinomadura sp. NEAU-AAG7]|uniref:S8 family peptidase n=1 Tax=Actinomadura sp. NEAU-AAG7 TaxID=2839640 RepID=UPI001BE4139D|nr:S8 family peptidase [Actinomadura sp. NEAU-AAG7]MBT2207564.1 S8 family peptidase [Actinomadura sp. NEAU-AAG7]